MPAAQRRASAGPPARGVSARPSKALPTWMLKIRWPIVARRPPVQKKTKYRKPTRALASVAAGLLKPMNSPGSAKSGVGTPTIATTIEPTIASRIVSTMKATTLRPVSANVRPGATSAAGGGGGAQPTGADDRSAP